jgi:hypothetical protein
VLRLPTLALAGCLAATAAPAAQPQHWRFAEARDFLEGELTGLSVDSEGRVTLAPAAQLVHDTEAPVVWALAEDEKGALYVGTGNEGKVFKVAGGKASLFFDAAELEVHALAVGRDGRVFVGTSPEGKVYAVDASGRATPFFDPSEKYIWALRTDASGNLIVATGAEGRVYRVDAKGVGAPLLNSSETHILSLAVDAKGTVYAGSAPSAILYRLDPAGKVFIVNDAPFREVRALETAPDGSLFAALVEARGEDPATRAATGAASGVPEVTVTETITAVGVASAAGAAASPAPGAPGGPLKGALLRVLPGGEIDTLWSSAEDTPLSLARTAEGLIVGTGSRGKLFRVRDDRSWAMLAAVPADQVTALLARPKGGVAVASSNPGRVFALDAVATERGTFVSRPRDTETVSAWGHLSWDAVVPADTRIEVETRSGNTQNPDATWTEWSPARPEGDSQVVTSERARFLQLRITLVGKGARTPILKGLAVAYLQRNLRPEVPAVTVHPPGEVFQKPISVTGEPEILGLDPMPPPPGAPKPPPAPAATSFSRKLYQRGLQTFSWRADDPNGDTLAFDVYFRTLGDNRFRILKRGLTEPVLAWDTTTVPNGRYLVKVVATDAPANPGGLALTGERESAAFDVDNTPPAITVVLAQKTPPRVRATVRDDASAMRRAEYSVDGGRWEEVYPVDGINDSRDEAYEFTPDGLTGAGPHVVVVRVTDLLGNAASARVDVP